ncbi:SlyX family protein [Thioalkalivibrio sulfidiphilus]|uniref:SlyX family protein n=1 Tax=Thioalkalivibrio sulfidiphilus TaxID=1033854 RepID=UPI003B2D716D
MSDALEARVMELETRLAHQEDLLQSLNLTMIEQQQRIDSLQLQMEGLRQRLAAVIENPLMDPNQEPPPPHY